MRLDGHPVCFGCWIELSERKWDNGLRKMGKLKGKDGAPKQT